MIRLIITGLALATTLALRRRIARSASPRTMPGRRRTARSGSSWTMPARRSTPGLRLLERGGHGGGRAIDQTLVVPSQPSFGALASAMIGTPVLDSDGKAVAEVADLVVVPDGRVTLVVLRLGGMLGYRGTLKAADFATLETAQYDGRPAYRHRGDLAALPSYRTAGED